MKASPPLSAPETIELILMKFHLQSPGKRIRKFDQIVQTYHFTMNKDSGELCGAWASSSLSSCFPSQQFCLCQNVNVNNNKEMIGV